MKLLIEFAYFISIAACAMIGFFWLGTFEPVSVIVIAVIVICRLILELKTKQ